MYLDFTAEQQALRKEIREYYRELLTPEARAALEQDETGGPVYRELVGRMGADGWLGIGWPVEYGGQGRTPIEQFIFWDETYRARAPLPMISVNTVGPTLMQFGSEQQKADLLPRILKGELFFGIGYTEPEAGTDLASLQTRAVRDGDDYVINGQKWFTSSADGAAFAIVMAVTDPDAPPYQRTSMIIVPTDTPGFNLVRNVGVMGHVGSGHASHAEVIYQSCRVPQSNLLGSEGGGFVIAQERLGPGRIHHCMRWLGIAARSFDLMCARANERVIAPDGDTLADRQVIQHWAAELDAEIRGARLQTLHAAWMIDRYGAKAARDEISAIKFSVANTMLKAVDTAIQVHGALGVTDDTILSYWYRHERAARIYDGADEVHKDVVARHILRQYGFDPRVAR
jgi:acyl-CoA dehydrogenase